MVGANIFEQILQGKTQDLIRWQGLHIHLIVQPPGPGFKQVMFNINIIFHEILR